MKTAQEAQEAIKDSLDYQMEKFNEAVEVAIKEKRNSIIVSLHTPLSQINENKLIQLGYKIELEHINNTMDYRYNTYYYMLIF